MNHQLFRPKTLIFFGFLGAKMGRNIEKLHLTNYYMKRPSPYVVVSSSTIILFILTFSMYGSSVAYADTIKQDMDGGMNVEITWPDNVLVGKPFSVSVLVQNNGWEDKQDVRFIFDTNDDVIIPETTNTILIPKITQGSSFGETINFIVKSNALPGSYFLNLNYSQILLANNDDTQKRPTSTNIAIPITIQEQPRVNIHTITPQSIFANAEFPMTVEITSSDDNIYDVELEIIPADDIEFRGQTLHTFSTIHKNEPISITSIIITPIKEIKTEYKVPFQVHLRYSDDVDEKGEIKTDSKTVSLTLRPRTFMELTTDGGIWLGSFFIAPYVSIGTIIGIPAGTLFSIILRRKRSQKSKKRRKSATTTKKQ
jgi:hypothetical protein